MRLDHLSHDVSPPCLFDMCFDHDARICVPLNEKTWNALTAATAKAEQIGDMVELRLDGLEPRELELLSPLNVQELIHNTSRPIVITFRSAEQGGYRPLTQIERRRFWERHLQTEAAFFDLESDLVTDFTTREAQAQPDWSRVICSYHDFEGVPGNLEGIYEQIAFTPARVLKIAVQATDIVDCLEVFKLLERGLRERRDIIALAMGNAGVITRILGPARGSFLTYGASEEQSGTAPGQVVASDLRSVYRVDQIDSDTMITGLVGLPVMQSVSPHMHNAAFQAASLNGVYLPFEVRDLKSFFSRMVNPRTRELDWNLRGLSVTAPHKAEVMNYLDWIDPHASEIGAVNTVLLENDQLLGYNTDAEGLIEPLIHRLGSLVGSRASVLGAGGAASAAVFALLKHKADVTLYVRNFEKAKAICERFNISCKALASASFEDSDIVINATPLGSLGAKLDETPAVADQLRGSRLVYDLVYNPLETRFLREARDAGCEILFGLEMLVSQAKRQFKLWTKSNGSSELMYTVGSSALTKKFSHY